MTLKILILGVNGFIGSTLSEKILAETDWEVYGMDVSQDKIQTLMGHPRFHFSEGDITINTEWIEFHVKKCDVVLPLVAIANPAQYVQNPIGVFELDFEANLPIIRECVKYNTRVIFPSTSEVYGMSTDKEFHEESSNLVVGPICKQRWIYSCSKQLLDRIIFAYGEHNHLPFTIFRPFNWIGPKLDDLHEPKEGSSRVLTQFISNILYTGEIKLINGGQQHRSFTCIDDGIDALMRIIENKNQCADKRIFNIGNPKNDLSIADLAHKLVDIVKSYPKFKHKAEAVKFVNVDGEAHFGSSYQDLGHRVPSIENAKKYLGWEPKVDFETALRKTLDYHFTEEKVLNLLT